MSAQESYRILVTGPALADEAREIMAARGCAVAYVHGEGRDGLGSLTERVRDHRADGLIVRKGKVDRAVLAASDRLRAVCKHGVGVDNIDVRAAAELGIVVMNTPGANFESVAEHTLALMFALARRLPGQDARVRESRWDKSDYRGHELAGKTLGLIGFGRVGRRVAELVAPLGMEIMVYDPWAERSAVATDITFAEDLGELLPRADIVSLHCPLTADTRGMIGSDQLRRMRRGVWLINTARGAIVDEDALIQALQDGSVGAAGLDTFETEPPDPDNPLFSMDNVVLTNHIAGISVRSFRNMGVGAVENVLTVLDGKTPDPSVVIGPT
jgi:D-3-phosphoglycerate dehydrogenase